MAGRKLTSSIRWNCHKGFHLIHKHLYRWNESRIAGMAIAGDTDKGILLGRGDGGGGGVGGRYVGGGNGRCGSSGGGDNSNNGNNGSCNNGSSNDGCGNTGGGGSVNSNSFTTSGAHMHQLIN